MMNSSVLVKFYVTHTLHVSTVSLFSSKCILWYNICNTYKNS